MFMSRLISSWPPLLAGIGLVWAVGLAVAQEPEAAQLQPVPEDTLPDHLPIDVIPKGFTA